MTSDTEQVMARATPGRVRTSRHHRVALIEINRPAAHNALDDALLTELIAEIEAIQERSWVRALILTGAGESFCSGDDLKVALTATPEQFANTIRLLQTLTIRLLDFDKPTIAALNGPAYGGGLELALNCDMRIATCSFRCATPEVRLGLTPTNGASILLPLLIGPAKARRMLFGGARVDAQWCLRYGLVDELTSREALLPRAIAIAKEISSGAPLASAATLRLLNAPLKDALAAAIELENKVCLQAHASGGREAVQKFLSERAARRPLK